MSAFVAVTDHPYHTVTDASGTYEIRDLPAGTYRVRIWHEELGTQEQPLTIEAGKAAEVNFTSSARETPGRSPDDPRPYLLLALGLLLVPWAGARPEGSGTVKGTVTTGPAAGQAVADAVVMIEGPPGRGGTTRATMNQQQEAFVPHVLGVAVGHHR